jgi:hypothetical protein
MTQGDLFEVPQFSLNRNVKNESLLKVLNDLHRLHYEKSTDYHKITVKLFHDIQEIQSLSDLPFVPVSLFKNRTLKSIPEEKVYKVLTSSGTTGTIPSRIYLDTETARLQTLALSKIITHVIGNQRLPMIIVDSKSVLNDRKSFSARGAGILGLSVFGKDHLYLLDDRFEPKVDELKDFLTKHAGQRILIFGFTSLIWQYLYSFAYPFSVRFENSVLIHSGGWKKMQDKAIDNAAFREMLFEKFGLKDMYNFYGMVEQVGSVYIENSKGYLHCPNFADIIVRNPLDFSVQPHGIEGLIQVISALPLSYPGHSILTEDIGVCLGEDDLKDNWKGKYFNILGRAKKADLRGCSDTFSH